MRSRIALAAVMLLLLAAAPASASILSATSQTVGKQSSNAEYLRVSVVQDELNATMRDMNDTSASTGSIGTETPSVGEGGYVLEKDLGGRRGFDREAGGDLFEDVRGTRPQVIAVGTSDHPSRRFSNARGHEHRGNDPHAAPEPSTWLMLGTGLALLGSYAVLRRRLAIEH